MTTARVAEGYVEAVITGGAAARVAETYAEVVISTRPPARVAEVYVEVVVAAARGGWSVGMIRMNA